MDEATSQPGSAVGFLRQWSVQMTTNAWPVVVVCVLATLIGLAPSIGWLWPRWWDSITYSHGLLIAPICVWLLWQQKSRIEQMAVRPAWWALVPLAAALFIWILSYVSSVAIGVQVLFPVVMILAVLAAAGYRVALATVFPIGFLFFAIPVWDLINGVLLFGTVEAVGIMLAVIGVPAFITGNSVQIPSGWFEIAGGCSGLHFFIVSMALAALYGHLFYRRLRSRLLLLGVAALMALVVNWLRVSTIITVGHVTDMQHFLVRVDHYYFGWVLFGLMLIPFIMIARKIEHIEQAYMRGDNERASVVVRPGDAGHASWLVVAGMVIALPLLVWGRAPLARQGPLEMELPGVAGWQGPEPYAGIWQPVFSGANGEAQGVYRRGGAVIDIYVNWYRSQSQGRELIGYGNSIAGPGLFPVAGGNTPVSDQNHAPRAPFREIILRSSDSSRRVVWFWYQIGDRVETQPAIAKLRQGWRVLTGRDGAGLIALSAGCEQQVDRGCDTARQALTSAFPELVEAVQATLVVLPKTGGN